MISRRTHVSRPVWGVLVLTATCFAVQAEEPQDEARRLARELLVVTGQTESDVQVQVLVQLVAQFRQSGMEQLPGFFEALEAEVNAQDMSELVIPVYVEHLSVEEMQAALDYYHSPLGRSMLEKLPLILQESMIRGQGWEEKAVEKALDKVDEPFLGELADKQAQKRTVADLREIGAAFISWWIDEEPKNWTPDRQGLHLSWKVTGTFPTEDAVRAFMALPYEEVVKILVPDYIAAVPKEDGWGHPYQFAINDDLTRSSVVSFRSPGRDGVFQSDLHEAGPFSFAEYDQDIVWSDGSFITWPQRR
jgi:hypothetical protein